MLGSRNDGWPGMCHAERREVSSVREALPLSIGVRPGLGTHPPALSLAKRRGAIMGGVKVFGFVGLLDTVRQYRISRRFAPRNDGYAGVCHSEHSEESKPHPQPLPDPRGGEYRTGMSEPGYVSIRFNGFSLSVRDDSGKSCRGGLQCFALPAQGVQYILPFQ